MLLLHRWSDGDRVNSWEREREKKKEVEGNIAVDIRLRGDVGNNVQNMYIKVLTIFSFLL